MPATERTHLWLTDRSRIVAGQKDCRRLRFLEYHFENGYGIKIKAESIPLATGTFVHAVLAKILQAKITKLDDKTRPLIRKFTQDSVEKYKKLCTSRGFTDEEAEESGAAKQIIEEQAALIEGLVWGWCKTRLESFHQEFEVLAVEEEIVVVFDCTCGLGSQLGSQEDHELRACEGIGQMVKSDIECRRRSDKSLGVHDFKTLSYDSKSWRDQWEVNVQMAVQTLGTEARHGEKCNHFYIHGLVKGQRKCEYNPETGEYDLLPKLQQSVLVYGYFKASDPPNFPKDDWKLKFRYWSETGGRSKTGGYTTLQGKGYEKVGVWAGRFPEKPEDWGPVEWWVEEYVPGDELEKLFILVGPHQRPDFLIQEVVEEIVAEERDWQEILWELYESQQEWENTGGLEVNGPLLIWPEFKKILNQKVRRSWECKKYTRDCVMLPVCLGDPGMEDPLKTGRYKLRRPHHIPEEVQMTERGVELPEKDFEEEEE